MNNDIFEKIKRINEFDVEYWSSRDLAKALDYANYQKFLNVIQKAQEACENSGQDIHNHFARVGEMVQLGSGAKRKVETFQLSRYACYLIIQNSDPSKEVVALGQTYFAIQTRRLKNLVEPCRKIYRMQTLSINLRKELKELTKR